ncbi:hypothetical protein [Alkalilimnicola sp. S0819]|uniref:hypothetical protein n=1 Tax=Alkalilimnicola sp. S0819 TaxID=2613922 RepID=UPI001262A660|nr:hypothetical protein [Alkalilimnicola sp. S0819]KAB7623963.1 hypothetical protein F3N43_07930 [Alkalilimnicola sp. S0819]MPQ16564.1 hypothetical protein [Alkalilimnicola sp. S0819]
MPGTAGQNLLTALLAPLLIWSGHFLGSYVFLSVGCARAWNTLHWVVMDPIRLGLWLGTVGAVLALLALLLALRRGSGIIPLAGASATVIALVAVTWTLFALPFASPCL